MGVVADDDRQTRPLFLGAHYNSVIAAPCADDARRQWRLLRLSLGASARRCQRAMCSWPSSTPKGPPYFLGPAMSN